MGVSRGEAATLLFSFTSKIGEAVILVPRMGVTEKLKAVQFWNVVSEKLQDIVNKNAADINAVASNMADSDANKLCMEMNSLTDSMNILNNTSDFIHTPSTPTIYNEYNNQFHNTDLNNGHSKHSFPAELVASNNGTQHTDHNLLIHQQHNEANSSHHMNQVIPHDRNETSIAHIHDPPSLPDYVPQPGNSSVFLDTDVDNQISNRQQHSPQLDQTRKLEVSVPISNAEVVPVFRNLQVKEDDSTFGKPNSKILSDSEDSVDASGFESAVNLENSNEGNPEPISSFAVSNTEAVSQSSKERVLRKNKKNCNTVTTFDCRICGKQYSNHAALKQHRVVHKKSYSCTECSSVFATNANLIVHMRKHTGEKPYTCHQCSACFTTQGNLKRHIGKHNGEKPFKCEKCDSRFTEKKSLTVHMRRHTGERPYKCKVCGNGFTQSGVLESHMAMHLGIKKHLCETCGKAFRQKSQLHVHKLRHDKVKRFKCDICSMHFLTKGDLDRHMKTHSGEKPYACDVCNKRFTRQQSLNDHLNRHYGIKPYTCQQCGKKFVEMSSYYKHIKFHNKPKKDSPGRDVVNSHEHEISKPADHPPIPETGNCENVMPLLKPKNPENGMTSIEEGTQYITVVLNGEETQEVQNLNNQTMLCNSGNSESNIATNNFGVLTAINLLSNASIIPQGFLS